MLSADELGIKTWPVGSGYTNLSGENCVLCSEDNENLFIVLNEIENIDVHKFSGKICGLSDDSGPVAELQLNGECLKRGIVIEFGLRHVSRQASRE